MISDRGSIQYVAHIGGVQIVGQLPPSMAHIKLKDEVSSRLQIERFSTICELDHLVSISRLINSISPQEQVVFKRVISLIFHFLEKFVMNQTP
jgi:hypothetical protein